MNQISVFGTDVTVCWGDSKWCNINYYEYCSTGWPLWGSKDLDFSPAV